MTADTATAALLRVTDLEVAYGEARALFGVSFDVPRGLGHHRARRQRSRQVVAGVGDRGRRHASRRAHRVRRRRHHREVAAPSLQARTRVRTGVAQPLPAPLGARQPVGPAAVHGSAVRATRGPRAGIRAVPDPRGAPTSAGGHAVGRRAADAQPGACARGAAEVADRRRDVTRSRPIDGRPRVRVARKGARRGRDGAADRAVRGAGAGLRRRRGHPPSRTRRLARPRRDAGNELLAEYLGGETASTL